MNKNQNEKQSLKKSVCDLKNKLPLELTNGAVIEICSDRQITIDGCKGISEYSDFTIKIKTSNGLIAVSGRYLTIKYLSVSSVVIEGKILNVEFIDWR